MAFFDLACSTVKDMVIEQSYQLLNQVIVEFSHSWWGSRPDLQIIILNHIVGMTYQIFGREHPLARSIYLLGDSKVLQNAAPRVVGLASEVIDVSLGPFQEAAWKVKLATLISMLELKSWENAEHLCWSIIEQARRQKRPRTSWVELHALEKLAWIRFNQGQDEEAELLCLEVLQRNLQETGCSATRIVGADACTILVQLCLERGSYAEAEVWQTMQLEGAFSKKDLQYATIFRRLRALEDILNEQGKVEEICRLHEDLQDVYQKWDETNAWPQHPT